MYPEQGYGTQEPADWLSMIVAKIAMVTSENLATLNEPSDGLAQGEHAVGEVSTKLKKILYLRNQCRSKIRILQKRLRECTPGQCFCANNEALAKEGEFFRNQYDVLDNIFWISLRDQFPELRGKSGIGFRKGWCVVWYALHDPLLDMLIKHGIMVADKCQNKASELEPVKH